MRRPKKCRLFVEQLEPRLALSSYFVSPTGNDNNAGTSAAPWLTLQHASDKVVAGDTVTVRAGTYAGFVLGWDFPQNGTASNPITFQADPGVIVNSRNNKTPDGIDLEGTSYITINGFDVENPSGGTISRAGIRAVWNLSTNAQGVIIENSTTNNCGTWGIFTSHEDGILIQNNVTSNSQGQHGIYVSNASVNPVIEENTSFGNADAGIQLNGDLSQGGTGLITGALIAGNIIHDNGAGAGGSAINLDGVQSSIVENNLLYNNHASGISLFKIDGAAGSINNLVVNNTIVMASDARWALNIKNASTGNTVFNNILFNAGSNGAINIASDSLPGFTSNFNVVVNLFSPDDGSTFETLTQWQNQTGQDKNSIVSTPSAVFVNPTANNYQELSTAPSVNTGVSQLAGHSAPTIDIASTTRPQGSGWDTGAYELVASAPVGATHFRVTAPSSATAGSPSSFTITALDASNNTVTTYTGTIHFASTDSQSVLPADYTFTAGDAGVHTFTKGVTLKTAGTQSVTATDTVINSITGSASVTISPAAASSLVVNGYPSPTTAGVSHSFTVTVKDAFGNVATSYSGTVVFSSSDSKAVLPAAYSFTNTDAGSHAFMATLMTPGTQTINSADTANGSVAGAETGISVLAAAVQGSIAGPTSGVRGQPLTFSLGASEPGLTAGATFSYSIQWGDGSALQTVTGSTGVKVTHTFTGNGTFTVQVTAADSTGNAGSPVSQSENITITALQADPSNSSQTALVVGGTTVDDTIVFSPANSAGGIKVVINGVNQGIFAPTGHIIAYGQSGNDSIRETSQRIKGRTVFVNVPALLFAGNGTDSLNVSGSIASNVLIGGAGNDTLIGGKGRDILIGGLGTDTLQAGSGGDILIGGTTAYDNNAAALAAVLTEWSRTDIDYATRIAHITGSMSGGLNGGNLLNSSTVKTDGLVNSLSGGAGLDWYFASAADQLFNQSSGEVATPI